MSIKKCRCQDLSQGSEVEENLSYSSPLSRVGVWDGQMWDAVPRAAAPPLGTQSWANPSEPSRRNHRPQRRTHTWS